MKISPYLIFDGRCEEAIEFYKKALGAEVLMMMRFKDSPEAAPPGCTPASMDNVMHATLRIGDADVMASDGMPGQKTGFNGFSLSLDAKDEAHAKQLFNALADGGQVNMPLGKTFFSPCFGMVADRFGLSWMVIVVQPQ